MRISDFSFFGNGAGLAYAAPLSDILFANAIGAAVPFSASPNLNKGHEAHQRQRLAVARTFTTIILAATEGGSEDH